jgi:hypothetical protein
MYVEEEDYEHFKRDEVNYLNKLNYQFNLNQRFVNVKDDEGNYFKCQTPFLKVLKPVHVTLNKKKTIAKKYIILELSDDLDFNHQIGDFTFIINKIHEISQEKIRENSMEWFNTEFDEIGLDIKVRRPIEQQRECEFIRICIPQNKQIEEEINLLQKGDYILTNIFFRGLKVSNDYINEEWEMNDFITQEKYEQLKKTDLLYEDIENMEKITTIIEDEYQHEVNEVNENKEENKNELNEINENKEETENELNKEVVKNEFEEMSLIEVNNGECEQEIIIETKNSITYNDINENKEEIINNDNIEEENIKKKNKEKKVRKENISENKNVKDRIKENKLKKLTNNSITSEQVIKKNKKLLFF